VILHTKDSGRTWEKQFDGEELAPGKYLTLSDIFFVDSNSGWAVGVIGGERQGIILRTIDGGKTWTHQKISGGRWWLNKVLFVNDKVGWIMGRQRILHTEDGGLTWVGQEESLGIPHYGLTAMHFFNEKEGWITGEIHNWKDGNKIIEPILFQTEDGGETWSRQQIDMVFEDIFFVNRSEGWGVGRGLIAQTKDGGKTWVRRTGASYSSLDRVDFVSPQKGWAVGSELLETEDGINWNSIPAWRSGRAFDFVDENRGWIQGINANLYGTTDGGANWEMLSQPDGIALKIRFLDSQRGWMIMFGGKVFYTPDGGINWELRDGGWGVLPNQIFNETSADIDFVENEGWVVCRGGDVYYTSDGGEQWQRISTIEPPNRLIFSARGICFANSEEGWVVAGGIGEGKIYHTKDGGKNWRLQARPIEDENLMDICYDGGKHLYAVGNWGAILRYTDYKLLSSKAVERSGKQMTSLGNMKSKAVIPTGHPATWRLYQNYPNPFNAETWIPYQLASDASVSIHIYDIRGQLVRLLKLGQMPGGIYRSKDKAIYWDGRDSEGFKVASGLYFYTLEVSEAPVRINPSPSGQVGTGLRHLENRGGEVKKMLIVK
jgi:photosystem II stability/assembly factor-like uncharacterized protein